MTVAIEKTLGAFAREVPGRARVLDVGCGNRPYQGFFSHCEYVGIDVETSGRKTADKQADVFYDGENIPFPDRDFGAVMCTQVFEHCLNPDKLIREIHRVLQPGGGFFFSVPFMWGEHEVPYDFRRFTSFGCKRFLEANGFQVSRQERADAGTEAIRTMVLSELAHCRNSGLSKDGIPALARPFLDKAAMKMFDWSLKIWKRRFTFPRIYLDNIVIARKA